MFWKLFAHIAQAIGSRCRSCGRPIIMTDEYGRAEGGGSPCREAA